MRIFLLLLFFFLSPLPALAVNDGYAVLQAFAVSAEPEATHEKAPAEKILVAVSVLPPEKSYFYGPKATTGLPTTLLLKAFDTGSGKELAVKIFTPEPQEKKQSALASETVQGIDDSTSLIYPDAAVFLAEVKMPEKGVRIEASIKGLFCSSANCAPFSYTFTPQTINKETVLPHVTKALWFEDWNNGYPVPVGKVDLAAPILNQQPSLSTTETTSKTGPDPFFSGGAIVSSSEAETMGAPATNSSKTATPTFVLQRKLEPQSHMTGMEISTLWQAVFFGMIAGLILNLMPCVLPVISLKFSALLAVSTMRHKQNQARVFRWHCLLFALGILTWFGFLAVMVGAAGWAWGEVFQNPIAIACMGLLLFLLGLSMFNVYTLPVIDFKVGRRGTPRWQAFASGLLATLLATPCSGPFLGGVIGWAIHQPVFVSVIAILSVGLGMTLPYLALAFSPQLINLLPKPGGWTIRLEQFMGFMLMWGVAYFMLLLPTEWYAGYLIILLAIAFAAWLWGQIGHLGASTKRRYIARSVAALVLIGSLFLAKQTLHKSFTWEPFSVTQVTALLGKEPLMLEFTADWCPNCKVLEHTTLQDERMEVLRNRYKMRTIRVDLTRFDEMGFALLEELGSKTLPFIALFPAGENANKPLILRDIVTSRQLEDALEAAFNK